MAVPKHKTSKSKTKTKRRINMKMSLPQMTECSECGELTPYHKVCIHCGYYKGNLVVEVENA